MFPNTSKMETLTSRVIKTEPINWTQLKFIQQDSFKSLSKEDGDALKTSILKNQFAQPFYVWQDGEDVYCLDGKHRVDALLSLIGDGFKVPEFLPATFIQCENKHEAAKLVLIYSSIYAKISQQGLFDFVKMYELSYDDIKSQMAIPEMSMERYEQKFDVFGIGTPQNEDEYFDDEEVFVSVGDLFEINGHRIFCGSFKDKAGVEALMSGQKARILNCDPPYNLPADFFLKDNKRNNHHKDFAEGAGEMSDEEFMIFLSEIMQAARDNTVTGAIHYIFMDFRHSWHMCEAARHIYGNPTPKQICVWAKDIIANGSFYRAQHELCFIFSDESQKALWNNDLIDEGGFYKNSNELCFIFKNGDGAKHLSHLELKDRIRSNVWKYPSGHSRANPDRGEMKNHPTPKPVAMIADSILDTTNLGDIVIDWFLGSGTCLIACEQTKRFCYATEIEPKYVQSIIKRYIKYCDKNDIDINFKHLNGSLTLKSFINEPVIA